MRAVLNARGVTKEYKQGRTSASALSPVDISVNKNEFVCIIGPNGCGKSTLLKLIAGILEPSSGSLKATNKSAYLPQQPSLLPWRSVIDNLLLPADLQKTSKIRKSRAQSLLKEFDLARYTASYPHTLSGGMQQKAALLRTVLPKPELMLLDEPFSALDAITRIQMQDWLLKLWQKDRPAVICVTHDIREAIFLADTIYVMGDQPGGIKQKINVPLARPRRQAQLHSPQAAKLESRLHRLLGVRA